MRQIYKTDKNKRWRSFYIDQDDSGYFGYPYYTKLEIITWHNNFPNMLTESNSNYTEIILFRSLAVLEMLLQ